MTKAELQDLSGLTGKDFEFLIVGDIDIAADLYDEIMTPNSWSYTKIEKRGWPYYRVDEDEYSYSWEPPGIQMVFNNEISFEKAKRIADEVISNINATGQQATLSIICSNVNW